MPPSASRSPCPSARFSRRSRCSTSRRMRCPRYRSEYDASSLDRASRGMGQGGREPCGRHRRRARLLRPDRADGGGRPHFHHNIFHARDARGRVWAPKKLVRRLKNRGVEVTDPFELGDQLPGRIQAFDTARDGEVLYWIPSERTLVVGDVLLGSPFRLCPKSWMGNASLEDLKAALRPLLDLPIERIHVGHGEPVVADGRAALADLL